MYDVNFFGSKFPGKGYVKDILSKILFEIIKNLSTLNHPL